MMSKKYNQKIVEKIALKLAALESACRDILCDEEFNSEFGKMALSKLKSSADKIRDTRDKLENITGELIFFGDFVEEAEMEGRAFPDSVWFLFGLDDDD